MLKKENHFLEDFLFFALIFVSFNSLFNFILSLLSLFFNKYILLNTFISGNDAISLLCKKVLEFNISFTFLVITSVESHLIELDIFFKEIIMLNDIISSQEIMPNEIKMRAYIAMGNICSDDIKQAYTNYKKAFELIEPNINSTVLAELYFKFATVCDDIGETETAIKLYRRCIDINKNNPHLASAMSNVAAIYEDTGAKELAIKYYKESLKIDEGNNNNSGIFVSAIKLAKLSRRLSPDTSEEYLKKATETAKKLNEPYYIMISEIEYGDFCIIKKDYKTALQSYLKAMEYIDEKTTLEHREKIERRIQDLKVRLGTEKFEQLEKEVNNG